MIPHRENLLAVLKREVLERHNEEPTLGLCFTAVVADWLGYELQERQFTDGKSDRGLDFWFAGDSGYDLFQVKSHEFTSSAGGLDLTAFDRSGVDELRRVISLLQEEDPNAPANDRVKVFKHEWGMALSKRRLSDEPESMHVVLSLVVVGEGLTQQAQAEYEALVRSTPEILIGGVPIELRYRLLTVDDLCTTRWQQDNREWRDKSGNKRGHIDLVPEGTHSQSRWMTGHNDCVFYCRAIDLVTAYDNFGYQIFEPNVRAHIMTSKVNRGIRDTLMKTRGRKEFRLLNNGVTITCDTFRAPKPNRFAFRVQSPGVINGLQTVVSLYQAYGQLSQQEREDFENNCFVLVRILDRKAVADVTRVVLTTNTQNEMKPRNLRSNTEEQILYERLFAELGWFYERKEGAWDAFHPDPARWRTLSGFRKESFQFKTGARPRERKLDNVNLAQTWLSFIGFSNEAVHKKRDLFANDAFYNLCFLVRTPKHGFDLSFKATHALKAATSQAPDPGLMLVSYFARELARNVPVSSLQAREEAIARLNLDGRTARETIDAELAKDREYVRNGVLSTMSFLFVEFVGYVLFRAFGEGLHSQGNQLLRTQTTNNLRREANFAVVVESVRAKKPGKEDFLSVCWFAFERIVDELLAGDWKASYLAARTRSRFVHDDVTRNTIYERFGGLEDYMRHTQLTEAWTANIPPKTSVTGYVASLVD